MLIRLGSTRDPRDAFAVWALATGAVGRRGFEFEHVREDVQTLNEWALDGRLDVTALSLHAYPLVQDRYVLLPHGSTMGSGRGPAVVSAEPLSRDELREVEIAIPGRMTTAFLVLKLYLGGEFPCREVPADRILEEVRSGRAAAGLVVDGGVVAGAHGLVRSADLGEWWLLETGLPLPLGVNVARRDLGADVLRELSAVLGDSIRAGLANVRDATEYALRTGGRSEGDLGDRVVAIVDDYSCDYGDEGRQAVEALLSRAESTGVYERPVRVEFVA